MSQNKITKEQISELDYAPIRENIENINASKTFSLLDENKFQNIIETCNLTVPSNATVIFPIGTKISGVINNSFTATFIEDSGVIIIKDDSLIVKGLKSFILKKIDTNSWILTTNSSYIAPGTIGDYWRGDKTFQTLDKTAVGLPYVDNTSDEDKPISSATVTALLGKSDTAHTHTFASLTSKPTTISGYGITDFNSLWDTRLTTKSTTDLAEGTNKYYTDVRVKTYSDTLYSLLAHTHTFASITSKPTTLSGYGITDTYTNTVIDGFINGKENSLGNPGVSGYILSSTTGGVRSWIPMSGGTGDVINGGNTVAAIMSVGTNNAYDLILKANNKAAIQISQNQGVAIGAGATVAANFSPIAIGWGANCSNAAGVAIGTDSRVEGDRAIGIGSNARPQHTDAMVLAGVFGTSSTSEATSQFKAVFSNGFRFNSANATNIATLGIGSYALDVNGKIRMGAALDFANAGSPFNLELQINTIKSLFIDFQQYNVFMGYTAGFYATGTYSILIGNQTGQNMSGGANTIVGNQSATGGSFNGDYNSMVGFNMAQTITNGSHNCGLGAYSFRKITSGNHNVGIGRDNFVELTTQSGNVAIGGAALQNCVANFNIAIGYNSGTTITTGANNIIIGANQEIASNTTSNQMNIGGCLFGTNLTGSVSSPAGQIGIGTNAPDTSAILDVTSTTKGILFPRVTSTQRDAISSPATSLLIFNTTTNQYEYYNGSAWVGFTGGGGGSGISGLNTDFIPVASSTTTIVDSIIKQVSGARIGINTASPDVSSVLDIVSTTKGFLLPRVTNANKLGISSPAIGLQVYDTDNKNLSYFDGTIWADERFKSIKTVTSTYSISIQTDYTLICIGTFTITLPTPSANIKGRIFVVKCYTGIISLEPTSGIYIDGVLGIRNLIDGDSLMLQCSGTNWFILASN